MHFVLEKVIKSLAVFFIFLVVLLNSSEIFAQQNSVHHLDVQISNRLIGQNMPSVKLAVEYKYGLFHLPPVVITQLMQFFGLGINVCINKGKDPHALEGYTCFEIFTAEEDIPTAKLGLTFGSEINYYNLVLYVKNRFGDLLAWTDPQRIYTVPHGPQSRPRRSFVWPIQDPKNWEKTAKFVCEQKEMIGQVFDTHGIDWTNALKGGPYHLWLEYEVDYRAQKTNECRQKYPDLKVYLALASQDSLRDRPAPHFGQDKKSPINLYWQSKSWDDLELRTAYLNWARWMIESFKLKPGDYLVYALEATDTFKDADDPKFKLFLNFFARPVYETLKKEYPELKIMVTFQTFYIGPEDTSPQLLRKAKAFLDLGLTDMVAVSLYPYWVYPSEIKEADPEKIQLATEPYMDSAKRYGKSFAISETTYPSVDVVIPPLRIKATDYWQADYIVYLMQKFNGKAEFVQWFVPFDFEDEFEQWKGQPDFDPFVAFWVNAGLNSSSGNKKQALDVWNAWR